MYEIKLTKPARKAYLKLPDNIRSAIYFKLSILAEAPFAKYNDVKRLQGMDKCYRLRIGRWRVIYKLYNESFMIEVIKIAHRKEVYR